MDLDQFLEFEVCIQLLISSAIGTLIGLEREYHSKAAGLRTMIMICLGSTIFTEISMAIGEESPDRIASNIITGIGFLGAGVIFKDGLTITGITTATAIWICAALGMAVGAGEYFVALLGSVFVLIVLAALQPITLRIERFHQARSYRIVYHPNEPFIDQVEHELKRLEIDFQKKRDVKEKNSGIIFYEVYGSEKKLDLFNAFLKKDPVVESYEY